MTPRYQALAMTALAVLTVSLGACIDPIGISGCYDFLSGEELLCPVVNPNNNKTIEVTTITGGEDIDPDGYRVEIRQSYAGGGGGIWGLNASANGKHTYSFGGSGPDGDHTVELKGVTSNCVVSGDNPRVVWIGLSQIAKTTFEIRCTAIP